MAKFYSILILVQENGGFKPYEGILYKHKEAGICGIIKGEHQTLDFNPVSDYTVIRCDEILDKEYFKEEIDNIEESGLEFNQTFPFSRIFDGKNFINSSNNPF